MVRTNAFEFADVVQVIHPEKISSSCEGPGRACRARINGFSLIEIMLVLLTLAVIAGMVAPMFGSSDAVSKLRAAAETLVADLAFAQIESISHGDNLRTLVFDTNNDGYFIAAADDLDTPITNPVGKVPYRVEFGEGMARTLSDVTISNLAVGNDDQLGFGAYGQLDQPGAATIVLACAGKTITITLDPVNGQATVGDIQ